MVCVDWVKIPRVATPGSQSEAFLAFKKNGEIIFIKVLSAHFDKEERRSKRKSVHDYLIHLILLTLELIYWSWLNIFQRLYISF